MQQPDFRDTDPYRITHTKDTDPAHPRSYKTCRPDENDSYATEVRSHLTARTGSRAWPLGGAARGAAQWEGCGAGEGVLSTSPCPLGTHCPSRALADEGAAAGAVGGQ